MSYISRGSSNISLKETKEEFKKVETAIKSLLYKLGDECENIQYNQDDLDEDFLKSQYRSIADKLEDLYYKLQYLSKEVTEQGYIKHNESNRYELPSGTYFTSGSTAEILYEGNYWLYTSIEHNGEDYYATALGRDISINGMMVRVRN